MIIHDNIEQGTQAWFQLRAGKPTASLYSNLVTSEGTPSESFDDYAAVLAAEVLMKKPADDWKGNWATNRGQEMEPKARAFYEFAKEPLRQVGFVTDDYMQWGCSPDGLTVKEGGAAEFKCLTTKEHMKTLMYHSKHGVAPPKYKQQTQGQIFVCDLQWCDLTFYHPDPELPNLVVRQERDDKFIADLHKQLDRVIAKRNLIVKTIRERY